VWALGLPLSLCSSDGLELDAFPLAGAGATGDQGVTSIGYAERMAIISVDSCPACSGSSLQLRSSREQSVAGGEVEWYCRDCRRVVADGGNKR
jgi:hypothetical protein